MVNDDISEIPLVGIISRDTSSLSSVRSSSHHEPAAASNSSGGGSGNASSATAGSASTTRLDPPAATATQTSTEDNVSRVDLAMMASSIALVVPVGINLKDLTICWEIVWKDLYGVLMIVSLTTTVTAFFTAWGPAVSWGKRLSPTCARLGLVDAAALFIVYLACKIGGLGCAAGVVAAIVVVSILIVVWVWSEQQATGRAEPTAAVPPAELEGAV